MLADDPAAPLDQHWRQHWHQHDLAVPWHLRAQGACTAAPSLDIIHEAIACA